MRISDWSSDVLLFRSVYSSISTDRCSSAATAHPACAMNMVRSIRPHRSYGGDHATIRSPCRRDVRALAGDGRRGAAIVVRRPVRRYRSEERHLGEGYVGSL